MPTRLNRAEQQARTRSALLEAAERVFVERGYQGSSVEAIAAAAGFTRGAFYSNFGSKEELFAELLQERAYARYREIAARELDPGRRKTLREVGEELAAIQAGEDGHWLFRLWLELLAHAGRDEQFRALAAEFWRGTREGTARALEAAYAEAGREPPVDVRTLASSMIALDIGLALQHFVDPDGVPLGVYPELYELLFLPHSP